MRCTDRLALATAQAVANIVIQRIQFTGFEQNRLLVQQPQGRCIGVFQTGAGGQLAAVKHTVRINTFFIGFKGTEAVPVQVLQFGNTNTVLAGNDPAQRGCQVHDPLNDLFCLVQHGVVIGIDGNVGMHVAIAGVHVGGDKQAARTDVAVDTVEFFTHRRQLVAGENRLERHFDFPAPGNNQIPPEQQLQDAVTTLYTVALLCIQQACTFFCRRIQMVQQGLPALAGAAQMLSRSVFFRRNNLAFFFAVLVVLVAA